MAAREILILRNMRLVAHVVKKYQCPENEQEELISIGTIGLIKAIATVDTEKGRLSTYAARCIENELLMHFRSKKKQTKEVSYYEPIGTDKEGNVYNINADTAAAEIATALQAENIITLTDIRGLLRDVNDDESLISHITVDEVQGLVEEGIIGGGMIPKVQGLEKAVREGVKKAVMIDGRIEHSILIEMFSDEGIGTMITAE